MPMPGVAITKGGKMTVATEMEGSGEAVRLLRVARCVAEDCGGGPPQSTQEDR